MSAFHNFPSLEIKSNNLYVIQLEKEVKTFQAQLKSIKKLPKLWSDYGNAPDNSYHNGRKDGFNTCAYQLKYALKQKGPEGVINPVAMAVAELKQEQDNV